MSEQKKSLLVIKSEQHLREDQVKSILQAVQPAAEAAGLSTLVVGSGLDSHVHRDPSELYAKMDALTEMIGQMVISNAELTQVLIEATQEDEEEEVPSNYLDGTPCL